MAGEQGKVSARAEGKMLQGAASVRHERRSQRAGEAWQSGLGRGWMGWKVDSVQTHEGLGGGSAILRKAPGLSQPDKI